MFTPANTAADAIQSSLHAVERCLDEERKRIANAKSDIEYAEAQIAKLEAIRDEHKDALVLLTAPKAKSTASTVVVNVKADTTSFKEAVKEAVDAAKAQIDRLKGGDV